MQESWTRASPDWRTNWSLSEAHLWQGLQLFTSYPRLFWALVYCAHLNFGVAMCGSHSRPQTVFLQMSMQSAVRSTQAKTNGHNCSFNTCAWYSVAVYQGHDQICRSYRDHAVLPLPWCVVPLQGVCHRDLKLENTCEPPLSACHAAMNRDAC